MTNFLRETRDAIERSGHVTTDIQFMGSADGVYGITWDEFLTVGNFQYDSGYGSAEIPPDFTIIFRDGKKMWRGEYDGSEWWEFDIPADIDYTKPTKKITNLRGRLWDNVAQLNGGE